MANSFKCLKCDIEFINMDEIIQVRDVEIATCPNCDGIAEPLSPPINLLENLLRDVNWYSRTLDTVYQGYKAAYEHDLQQFINDLADLTLKLEWEDDRVNFFAHEGSLYIGLESRRLDYERAFKALEQSILS